MLTDPEINVDDDGLIFEDPKPVLEPLLNPLPTYKLSNHYYRFLEEL